MRTTLLPKYQQIKYLIREWIISREYSSGDRLPTENELAKLFKVTRMTVRQGLAELSKEGLIETRKGTGSFVTTDDQLIEKLSLKFSGFMDDLFYQVSRSRTETVEMEFMAAPKLVAEKLQLDKDETDVLVIKRVRMIDNKLFAYTINYIYAEIGHKIKEKDLYEMPLLQILEQKCGVLFDSAFQTIQASFSSDEVAAKLEIPSGAPILFVERIMYREGKKPFEFVQSSYRGDIFKYVVNYKFDPSHKGSQWIPNSNVHTSQDMRKDSNIVK